MFEINGNSHVYLGNLVITGAHRDSSQSGGGISFVGQGNLAIANTTISRPALRSAQAAEAGGLSGRPLKRLALEQLRLFRAEAGVQLPLIAVGGIESADDAWDRIVAGASLVQLYSALVYEGPGLAKRIAKGLATKLRSSGFASLTEAVGSAA